MRSFCRTLALTKVILTDEHIYKNISCFTLDTIKQEKKLCYLYEKLGYMRTGKEEQLHDNMTIVFYEKKFQKTQL